MPYRGVRFDKAIEIGSIDADYDRWHRALGCGPLTDMREGLERSMAFYRDHRHEYWGDLGCSR